MTTQTAAAAVDDVLRVVADPARLAIVRALAAEQLCTCHLVEELGLRQPNVSNHLRVLRDAGLVTSEQVGRYTYHRLHPGALERLAGQFAELATTARAAGLRRRPC